MHLRSGESVLISLVVLLLLSVTAEKIQDQSDFCEHESDNCDLWTKPPDIHTDADVTYEQLKGMLSTGVQLFDVREPDEFEAGFISGATNIPLGEIDEALGLSPHQFKERYGVSKPRKDDSDFVLYCQRGHRSLSALETAWAHGYSRASHYVGGYSEWIQREAH